MVKSAIPKSFIKKIFPFLATLLLVPWPVAYVYAYTGDMAGHDAIRIEVADPSVTPSFGNVFGRAIGGITTPGDLFYIDATENAISFRTTLYLTNTQELSYYYRYLILKVGVYVRSNAGEWKKAYQSNGELIPDTFITLRNGRVSFILTGYTKYKITIDRGSFYCITTNTDSSSLSPQFYLEAG